MTVAVAVVGAGISGLAAAYELQRRGISCRVFESSDRAGGVIRTDRFDGWVVDGGPDSLLVQKPAAVELCRQLGLGPRLVSTLTPRTAFVLRNGRLHPIAEGSFLGFPIGVRALAHSSLFSLRGRVRMAMEVLVQKGPAGDDESIASFVGRRFGREAVDYLAEPLLAGIHAGDVDRLSVRSLFPRLVDAEQRAGSLLKAFRSSPPRPSPQGAFVSLPDGIGELVDALVSALAPETLVTSRRVTDLQRAGGFELDTPDGRIRAHAVILAVPAHAAGGMLRGVHTRLAALCDEIPYASTATVAMGYRQDQIAHPMPGSGFVVPRVERKAILAATWVTSKWPHRAPDGHVLLRAFLGGGRDPRRLDRTDDELIRSAIDDIAAIMRPQGDPVFVRLYRWARQSPQFEIGHAARLAAIETHLSAIPGLFVTGSGFRSIGIPDCIADARDTAGRTATYLEAAALN